MNSDNKPISDANNSQSQPTESVNPLDMLMQNDAPEVEDSSATAPNSSDPLPDSQQANHSRLNNPQDSTNTDTPDPSTPSSPSDSSQSTSAATSPLDSITDNNDILDTSQSNPPSISDNIDLNSLTPPSTPVPDTSTTDAGASFPPIVNATDDPQLPSEINISGLPEAQDTNNQPDSSQDDSSVVNFSSPSQDNDPDVLPDPSPNISADGQSQPSSSPITDTSNLSQEELEAQAKALINDSPPSTPGKSKTKMFAAIGGGLAALVIVAGGLALNLGIIGNQTRETTSATWCVPHPSGHPYGHPCTDEGRIECGADGRETRCQGGSWYATGHCCGDSPPTTPDPGNEYCGICSTSRPDQCECVAGIKTGLKCITAPPACSDLGNTWQPDSSCQSGDSCGDVGSPDGDLSINIQGGCIYADNTSDSPASVTSACFICSGPGGVCNNEMGNFLRGCGGSTIAIGPGETNIQIICSPDLNICENFQIDAHGINPRTNETVSNAIVGEHPTQGEACNPPTSTPAPVYACVDLLSSTPLPQLGQSTTLTCEASQTSAYFEFRYRVNNGSFQELSPASAGSPNAELTFTQAGTYQVQCRACLNPSGGAPCSGWDEL